MVHSLFLAAEEDHDTDEEDGVKDREGEPDDAEGEAECIEGDRAVGGHPVVQVRPGLDEDLGEPPGAGAVHGGEVLEALQDGVWGAGTAGCHRPGEGEGH
jgi:hypothetical protein